MINLRSFQVALFSNSISFNNKIEYASKLIAASDNIFDGDPAILPIPEGAPPEIPRIVVKSKDGKFICNTSINRVDLFFNPKKSEEADLGELKSVYLPSLRKVINFLNETYKFKIYRMGIVANFLSEIKESANAYIAKKYLKETNLISNTFEIQLHSLNKIALLNNKYNANRWLRIKSFRDKNNIDNDKFLVATIDINTLPDASYDIDIESVTMIFNDVIKNMQALIKLHYTEV